MANWMRRHLPTTRRVVYATMGAVLIAQGSTALARGRVDYPNYWGGKVFPPLAIVLGLASVGFAVADPFRRRSGRNRRLGAKRARRNARK